jgi:hypothetical protein
MTDDDLISQSTNVPTLYFDGFAAFRKMNGVLRCIGYVFEGGAQLNIIVSLAGADAANRENRRVLDSKEATKCLAIWSGTGLAH